MRLTVNPATGRLEPSPSVTAFLTKSQADTYYYPLSTNPAGYLTDAPSDGSTYGRKNGAWAAAGGGSQTPWTSNINGGGYGLLM